MSEYRTHLRETVTAARDALQRLADVLENGESSPATIPLGAPRKWWMNCYSDDDNAVHPSEEIADECADKTDPTWRRVVVVEAVADRATVERVAAVFAGAMVAGFVPNDCARRVLRALGYEVAE